MPTVTYFGGPKSGQQESIADPDETLDLGDGRSYVYDSDQAAYFYSSSDTTDTPRGFLPVQDSGTETNFTTTNWTVVAGLSVTVTSTGTDNVFRVDALLDMASYAANTATIVVNLTVDGTGEEITFPLKFPVNGFRDSVPCSWVITGLAAGEHTFGLAAYLTESGNYQSGSGTTMIVQRVV